MGRKWLDNYGQEDNYNDSKISLPKGFVGQGYDISGRNYSPAWEGQFQSGGNIESKWEYSNTNGKLIPQSQLKDSELGYLKDWLSSPMAKKIALKREGESGLNNLDIRLERLNDSNLEISTAEDLLKSTNSYTRRKGEKFNNKNLQGASYTSPSTKYGNIVTRRMAPKNVILHEGTHQSTSGNNLLLKNDVEDILSRVRNDSGSYLSNPTEVHARLNVLRKELKDSGVVDPFKTPVSKEHLNKFLNSYKKPGEISDKPLIEANSGELLNILNSQDDAVWLLNNIVSNQNNNLIPIAQNGRNLKRLLNENIKKDSNVYLNYTKKQNINPRREIRKEVDAIQTIQNKYNVSREKAAEIKQKLESEKIIKNPPKSPYEIKPGEDQSFLSKSWEVLTNPATAASYWLNDQRIPDRFSKGERNNLDIATDLFNPFGIVDSAKNAVKETISIPKNLYNGEYGEAGSNFLNAGLNTLSVVPALRELKGVKAPKINTSINSSSLNKELKNINPFLKVEKKDVLKTKPNLDFQVNIDDYKDEISALKKREIEYIDSPEYMNLRMKNTGETEDKILKSIHRIKKNMDRTTFNMTSRLRPGEGEYLNSISTFFSPKKGNFLPSLDFNPSINISSKTRNPESIIGGLDHEIKHGFSPVGNNLGIYRNYPTLEVSIPHNKGYEAYLSKPYEQQVRFNKFKDLLEEYTGLKRGQSITEQHLKDFYENGRYNSSYHDDTFDLFNNLSKNVTKKDILNTLNQAWSVIPIAGSIGYEALNSEDETPKYQNGGVIKDNNGYWNPNNWGKVVEIDSNDITMKGVNQPLLGISDEGDIQYMEPNKDYKFKGKKVREFPIARNGINNLNENSLQQLDQLTNFTNYNKLSNGGWLDKF